MNINFNGLSFKNADVGGCVFLNCSPEHTDFTGAKICGSVFNEQYFPNVSKNRVCFVNTRLFGSNEHESDLETCRIQPHHEKLWVIEKLKQSKQQIIWREEQDGFLLTRG